MLLKLLPVAQAFNAAQDKVDDVIELVVTPGCPSGVGPELLVKALAQIATECRIHWSGGPKLFKRAGEIAHIALLDRGLRHFSLIKSPQVSVLCLDVDERELPLPGRPNDIGCDMQKKFLLDGISLVKAKNLRSIVTGPIRKKALENVGGQYYPGQTELLERHLSSDGHPALMCFSGLDYILGLATVHIPLREVSTKLNHLVLTHAINRLHHASRWYHGTSSENTRLTVLGLNPHASEGGLIGSEDQELLIPVIESIQAQGLNVIGPVAADGFFGSYRYLHAHQRPHGVLALYHDQGLAPYKALCDTGVNFTWGLNVLRTSPGHGTADNLAGKNVANSASTIQAMELALRYARLPGITD